VEKNRPTTKNNVLIFNMGDELANGIKDFTMEQNLANASFKAIGACFGEAWGDSVKNTSRSAVYALPAGDRRRLRHLIALRRHVRAQPACRHAGRRLRSSKAIPVATSNQHKFDSASLQSPRSGLWSYPVQAEANLRAIALSVPPG
jgi:hypothetical protein